MITSESIKEISAALLEAQKSMVAVSKDSQNPFFSSTYADLESVINAIKEPLNNAGIVFLQTIDHFDDLTILETRLLHKSGEWISSHTPIVVKDKNNPQAMGSGITYSKRYALQAICGLPTTDDDGEAAMGRKKESPKEPQKEPSKEKEFKNKLPTQNVKIQELMSDKGRKYIHSQPSPDAAVEAISKKYLLDEDAINLIKISWTEEETKQFNKEF
jgi:hypothetical protein